MACHKERALLRDSEVLLRDGFISDPRVGDGHRQRLVAEQSGDGVRAYAAINGLGAECVGAGDP